MKGTVLEKNSPSSRLAQIKLIQRYHHLLICVLKKILYPEGKTLPVQTIIAQIEEVEVKKA